MEWTARYVAQSYTLPEDEMGDVAKGRTVPAARLAEKLRQRNAKMRQRKAKTTDRSVLRIARLGREAIFVCWPLAAIQSLALCR